VGSDTGSEQQQDLSLLSVGEGSIVLDTLYPVLAEKIFDQISPINLPQNSHNGCDTNHTSA
jgi:hypothetical protein